MNCVKSKQRVADYGEVLTPPWLVAAMLDLVQDETDRIESRFLEPACGSGNFLVQILQRKLATVERKYGDCDFERRHYALLALMCLYGIELLGDNIAECRANLLKIFAEYLKVVPGDEFYRAAVYVLSGNLVHGDTLKMQTHDGQAIAFTEWDYLGNGQYQRRDFRFDALAGTPTSSVQGSLFAAAKTCRPMTVGELAALASGEPPIAAGNKIAARRFDVIIGNPPYQRADGGYGKSAVPVYPLFVDQAKKLEPRYLSFVIPSRWFSGGKGLAKFRASMLADNRLRSIDDYLNAAKVFPGVGFKGGVCYFLWDRDTPGQCRVTTHFKDRLISTMTRPLLENGADIFIRFNEGLSILKKVVATERGNADFLALPETKRFDRLVSSSRPFGLRTFFRGNTTKRAGDVLVYQNGGTGYVPRSSISIGTELIDRWKVYVGSAAPGIGDRDTCQSKILSTPFIGEPGSISSETYLCIGPFDSKSEAESVLSYLTCRLTRLLILLHKPSQDTTRKVYTFVPTQDWTKPWSDEELYTKYALSNEEIAFVEKLVRPMTPSLPTDSSKGGSSSGGSGTPLRR